MTTEQQTMERRLSQEDAIFPLIYKDSMGLEWNRAGFNGGSGEETAVYDRTALGGHGILMGILTRSGEFEFIGTRPTP